MDGWEVVSQGSFALRILIGYLALTPWQVVASWARPSGLTNVVVVECGLSRPESQALAMAMAAVASQVVQVLDNSLWLCKAMIQEYSGAVNRDKGSR